MNEFFFHATMTVLALAVAGVSALGLHLTDIRVQPHQLIPKVAVCIVLVLVAAFYRWRREEKLLNVVMMTFWAVLFSTLHLFPMFIASRSRVKFHDAALARIDRAVGIEATQIREMVGAFPEIDGALVTCYNTLLFLMTLATIVPALCGKMRAAKEYAISGVVSAILSMPMFMVFQAIGPWVYYGYEPVISQDRYVATFNRLREYGTFTLDLSYGEGLICFPSFHTILAMLAAYALREVPYIRLPAALWALLIVISTATTGTHYVVDIIAGIGVAALSLAFARIYSRIERASVVAREC